MKKLGWIGCGNMGRPMAMNLLKHGWEIVVSDVVKGNMAPLEAAGAKCADSPRQVAEAAECMFTMLPNGRILKSVVLDERTGILAGLSEGKILVDMSTVAPTESQEVCQAVERTGAKFLRAPVTGSTVLAQSASLGVFASGDKAVFEQVLPMFRAMSSNQHYLGDGEQARVLKLAINLMVAANMEILAEAMVLVDKSGIDRAQAMDIIGKSAAGSPVVNYKTENVIKRDYTAAFSVTMMEKDLDLLLEAARQYHTALPVAALTRQLYAAIHDQGRSDLDFSCLVDFWENIHSGKR